MLLVENLVKEYKNTTAVDNISFKVEPGQIFGLLGPNGAGKTTTLRTVLNIIKPTSGKILFNNQSITTDFLNRIGYLPEERRRVPCCLHRCADDDGQSSLLRESDTCKGR